MFEKNVGFFKFPKLMFYTCRKLRLYLLRVLNKYQLKRSNLRGFWSKLFLGFLFTFIIWLHYFLICLVSSPVLLTKTPYQSFQLLARRSGSGVFTDSYYQHLVFQRATVGTVLLSILIIAIKAISILIISFYSVTPEVSVAKDDNAPAGCEAYRGAVGEINGCLVSETFDFGGVWWNTTGTCGPQDFTWQYYNYATGQTTTMDDSFTAFTVPGSPVINDVEEYIITDLTLTCRIAGHYRVIINIGGISPSTIDTFVGTPTAPTGALATPIASDTLTVNWADNSNNEEYYRIETASYGKGCGLYAEHGIVNYNNASYNITGLNPNTPYCSRVRASNPLGNTTYSTASPVRTYSPAPDINADRSTSTWYTSGKFLFTNNDVWGIGGTQYFRYVWNESPTHLWADTETQWSGSDLSLPGNESAGYYLHLKSYNNDDVGSDGDAINLGPYYYDSIAPPATGLVSDGAGTDTGYSNSSSVIRANWQEIIDETSGLAKYQYAVGTTPGGTNVINWSDHDISTSIELSGQDLTEDETYYFSVRGIDNAGLTSEPISSDGFIVDTINPLITSYESGEQDWLNSSIAYNVDFSNQGSGSLLDYAQYSVGSSSGATDVIDWTDIFTEDRQTYFTDWVVNFELLLEDSNYVSVKTADMAGNAATHQDVFIINKDTIPTVLSEITAEPDTDKMDIAWTTSEPTTTQLQWGSSPQLGYLTTLDTNLTTNHAVTLTGLNESQTYYYRILAKDRADNSTSSQILSSATSELTPTLITNVNITNITKDSAQISWITNHAASSKIRYGQTTNYGYEVSSNDLTVNHNLTISALKPNTQYHYEILSTGNTTAIDADATFTTLSEPEDEIVDDDADDDTDKDNDTEDDNAGDQDKPSAPKVGDYIFDLPKPTVLTPINNQTVAASKPLITGLSKSGNLIKFFIDDVYDGYATATIDSSGTGNFYYYPFLDLRPGEHTLSVEAWSDNHRSKRTEAINFFVPTPYVTPTIVEPIVRDGDGPTITIPGIALNNSRLKVYIDNSLFKEITTTNDASGTGSFSIDVPTDSGLTNGEHSITIIALDQKGRVSRPTQPIKFTKRSSDNFPSDRPADFNQPVAYEVKMGDSLWNIAKSFYGQGNYYKELVNSNAEKYPSLLDQPGLIIPGWTITIPVLQ